MSIRIEREVFALPRAIEPEAEIFAIGDIHGRPDLLAALLDAASAAPRREPRRKIVFLGDLIDRGPDSLGAIELSIAARAFIGADERISLMGNHETMMRMALDRATPAAVAIDALRTWMLNGGDEVLTEFIDADRPPASLPELLEAARASLPVHVERWLEDLEPHSRSGRGSVRPRRRQPALSAGNLPRRALEHAAREPRRGPPLGVGPRALPRP